MYNTANDKNSSLIARYSNHRPQKGVPVLPTQTCRSPEPAEIGSRQEYLPGKNSGKLLAILDFLRRTSHGRFLHKHNKELV